MIPHVCPKCQGTKAVKGVCCPTCEGSGVVWETTVHDVTATGQAEKLIHKPGDILRKG